MIDLLSGDLWLFVLFCTLSAALCGYFWFQARSTRRADFTSQEKDDTRIVPLRLGEKSGHPRGASENVSSPVHGEVQRYRRPFLVECDEESENGDRVILPTVTVFSRKSGKTYEVVGQMQKDLEVMMRQLDEMETNRTESESVEKE